LVFISLVIWKILKYSNTPVHVRWELYPVAHELNKYGGSYYEETNWWQKKRKKNRFAEFWAMFEEIIFLKGVYIHNKKLWFFSFPFHFGLYLIIGTFALILLSAILNIASVTGISNSDDNMVKYLHYLIEFFGYVGLTLVFIGSVGLLIQRATNKKFKFYNSPMDYINLVFILVLVISISLTLIQSNHAFNASKEYVINLITFDFNNIFDIAFIIHIILISLFFLYFPITRMMHVFAKYFTYHNVRWEDEPNIKGGKLEKKIKKALNFGVSWSAPHMKTGKTWAEVATTIPEEKKNEK
ncbi:respiratory nitrate reductase subunit gamma, partial [Bacteroidota bacterium]